MAEQRVIDGRGLMPPEPMELTLAALDTLPEGEELLLLLYCEPHPLYNILKQNGYGYRTGFREDGTVEVYISRR
ncbi:MAG: DUF2249 domain-containing protein [Pseudomonadota bacterium]